MDVGGLFGHSNDFFWLQNPVKVPILWSISLLSNFVVSVLAIFVNGDLQKSKIS